mgnify:FL=1|tara:strand:- start:24485 stop:25555 length:1071 start_codon:yes stop_codon:yes gene_type:complete
MNYGMFIMPFHSPSKPAAQCYDEDLELIVRAEDLGFSEFWIGEHHTMKYENIVLPEAFIGKALAMTNTIRLGTAPTCLPYHHPAYVATRLAFMDQLSHGRLNLCFGPGSVTSDLELYNIDPKLNSAMAEESAEIILQLWNQEPPYKINGRFWQIDLEENVDQDTLIGYIHKPLQKPHPPIFAPGMSMNSSTMKTAGKKGWAPISANISPGNVVADNWRVYEKAALEAGRVPNRSDWRVCRSIFIGDNKEETERQVRTNSMGNAFEYIGSLFDQGLGRKMLKRDPEMSDMDCNLDYLMQEQMIHGDVDEVVNRLNMFRDETGDFGTLVLMGYDWDDKEAWLHSMDLFVNEVIPALNS